MENVSATISLGPELSRPSLPHANMHADDEMATAAHALCLDLQEVVAGFPARLGPVRMSSARRHPNPVAPHLYPVHVFVAE